MIDVNDLNAIKLVLALSTVLLVSIWCGIITFLRVRKKKSLIDLLFVTVFYIYLYKVLDYTLFQFQSLLLLKHFMPDLMLNGIAADKSLNLIPLVTLTIDDLRTSLLNILLMVPFGFGLPFITNLSARKIVVVGGLFAIAIELLQLITGFAAKTTFRIADINDVIFNTVGVAVGYALFAGFVRMYRRVSRDWRISAQHRGFLIRSAMAQVRALDLVLKRQASN